MNRNEMMGTWKWHETPILKRNSPATDRSHDVGRDDRHDERSSPSSGIRVGALCRKQPEKAGGRHTEPSRHIAAHVVERDGDPHPVVQHAPDRDRRQLHPRVDCSTNRTTDRVPHLQAGQCTTAQCTTARQRSRSRTTGISACKMPRTANWSHAMVRLAGQSPTEGSWHLAQRQPRRRRRRRRRRKEPGQLSETAGVTAGGRDVLRDRPCSHTSGRTSRCHAPQGTRSPDS
jgi:hypothetical protein